MGEEQQNRGLGLEAALIFAAWSLFGLLLASQFYMQFELAVPPPSVSFSCIRGMPITPSLAV